MRKLTRYILLDFLAIFGTALLLITFAFSIGAIYKAIDIISKGVSVSVVGQFFLNSLPYSFAYTIPISALFSALLLFGRLSADSEIGAMRSGGLSLWQVSSPILLFSVGLVVLGLYINGVLYPKTTYANAVLLKSGIAVEDPIKLLEEGRFIREFPGYMIYVGKKNKNKVRDLVVYDVDRDTGKVSRTVRASSGILTVEDQGSLLKIDLFDVRIEVPDEQFPDDPSKTQYANAKALPYRINLDELLHRGEVRKRRKYMNFSQLIYRIRNYKEEFQNLSPNDQEVQRCLYRVEVHQKISLAVAAFTFVFVAIPLGIRSHRKESSMGMLLSLAVLFVYYIFIILSDTFDDKPYMLPWLLPWIPLIFGQIAGLMLMRRVN